MALLLSEDNASDSASTRIQRGGKLAGIIEVLMLLTMMCVGYECDCKGQWRCQANLEGGSCIMGGEGLSTSPDMIRS